MSQASAVAGAPATASTIEKVKPRHIVQPPDSDGKRSASGMERLTPRNTGSAASQSESRGDFPRALEKSHVGVARQQGR
jgi:hypothetical protein